MTADPKPLADEELPYFKATLDAGFDGFGKEISLRLLATIKSDRATIDALRAENERLKECRKLTRVALDSVPVMNSLRTHRNQYFQMQGAYDGAMGDECKELCRQQFNAIDSLIRELEKQ